MNTSTGPTPHHLPRLYRRRHRKTVAILLGPMLIGLGMLADCRQPARRTTDQPARTPATANTRRRSAPTATSRHPAR